MSVRAGTYNKLECQYVLVHTTSLNERVQADAALSDVTVDALRLCAVCVHAYARPCICMHIHARVYTCVFIQPMCIHAYSCACEAMHTPTCWRARAYSHACMHIRKQS